MCLTINRQKHAKDNNGRCLPIVLKTQLSVCKIVWENNISQFKYFPYTPNTTYKKRKLRPTKHNLYSAGFHAYLQCGSRRARRNQKIVMLTIPKGATVFYGINGEVITNVIVSGDLNPVPFFMGFPV